MPAGISASRSGALAGGSGDGKQRRNFFVTANAENFDVAVDVGKVNPRAVRRKHEAGETQLRLAIRRKNFRGNRRLFPRLVGREWDVLQDFSRCRIKHHQFMRQPGGDEQFSIGTQRQRLWPHAGQFDLCSSGRDDLVGGRDQAVSPVRPTGVRRGIEIHPRKPGRQNKPPVQKRPGAESEQYFMISMMKPDAETASNVTVKFYSTDGSSRLSGTRYLRT